MTKLELRELIQAAINQQSDIYESMKDDTNPQVQRMANITKGQKQGLSDVLSAINGNPVFLKMLAGK